MSDSLSPGPGDERIAYAVRIRAFWEKDKEVNWICNSVENYDLDGINSIDLIQLHARIDIRATVYARNRNLPSYRVGERAVVQHEKTTLANQITISPVDLAAWSDIDEEIRSIHAGGKTPFVGLIYHYARTHNGEATSTASNQPTAQQQRGPILTGSGTSSSHITTNNQLLQREISHQDRPEEVAQEALVQRWRCKDKMCEDIQKICWIDEKDEKRTHHELLSEDIRLWYGAVSKDTSGRLGIEEPPTSLRERLLRRHTNKEKNRLGANKTVQPNSMPPPTLPASAYTPYRIPPYPITYSLPQPSPQLPSPATPQLNTIRTSALTAELASRGVYIDPTPPSRYRTESAPPRRPSASPYPRDVLRSSPIEGDLAEFIQWMKLKKSVVKNDFDEAYNKLMDEGYTTEIFQPWKGDEHEAKWKALGIKPGVGRQLAQNVSKWGRERERSEARQQPATRTGRDGINISHRSMTGSGLRSRPGYFALNPGLIIPSIEQGEEEEHAFSHLTLSMGIWRIPSVLKTVRLLRTIHRQYIDRLQYIRLLITRNLRPPTPLAHRLLYIRLPHMKCLPGGINCLRPHLASVTALRGSEIAQKLPIQRIK